MGLTLPVFGELEQTTIKILGLRVLPPPCVSRVAVAELNLGDLAFFDMRGAVPGLYYEAVLRKNVAKDHDLVIRAVVAGQDFADRRHPATDESFVSFVGT